MKKTHIAPILLLLSVITTGIAHAQSYYPYVSGGCVSLSRDLFSGSRGSDVTSLQTFLVNQNYPGSGSWMVTGYFGPATAQAVRNFQGQQGLVVTGSVDSSTRSVIVRVGCGTYVGNTYTATTYPWNNYNTYNYNTPYNYNLAGNLALTSLSANTGFIGSSVTVYGTGFDSHNNIVKFGTTQIGNLPSNGTSITFNVPLYVGGNVDLRVTNSRGTSNPLTFTVNAYGMGCGIYGSYGCNVYGYSNQQISWLGPNYNYGGNLNPNAITVPTTSYLSPASGSVGTVVTVFGTGFTTTGNAVHFGPGVVANLNSPDGRSVSFTIPSQLTGFGTQVLTLSTYNVYVTNSAGYTSNTLPFTVTSLGASAAPAVWSVNGPTSLVLNTAGIWTIVVNNQSNSYLTTSVNWGDQNIYGNIPSQPQTTYAQGTQTLTFSHAYMTGGTYTITVIATNASGSNTGSATVTVPFSANAGNVALSYLSPSAGRVGTQIAIVGSGFTALDNTVRFGTGGLQHVPSQNGTTIYYTIPSYLTPCAVMPSGSVCAMYAQQVMPGAYPISVTNANGATASATFLVQ